MVTFLKYALPLSMGVAAIFAAASTFGLIIGIIGAIAATSTAIAMFKKGEILFALDLVVTAGLFVVAIIVHFGG